MNDQTKLTVMFNTRISRTMRSNLTAYARATQLSESEITRIALQKFLNGKRTTKRSQNAAKDTHNERAPQPATA